MWQISGPLRLLLIWGIIYILGYLHFTNFNFMKKIANSLFGAPNCRPLGEKGGLFYEKNANSCILGPILWAVLDKFRPKRVKGGEVIRPFVAHRVTE